MKEDIARMNLSNLYSASMGSFNQNVKDLQRPTSDKVRAMIEQHGYNTKKAMQALYFSNTIVGYHSRRFTDYGKTIWYEGESRQSMLDIKAGKVDWETMNDMLEHAEWLMKRTEEDYKSHEVNDRTLQKLQNDLHGLVFDSLTAGIV